ncbi:MAG: M48 family metallopeptidase [Candidatus Omnitrophica bacterium]|nr:M48 family metallopeptidase [Candidatus Omnitrophota bacterium]
MPLNINAIKILRSKKRRRSVSARLVKDILIVRAPESMPEVRLQEVISELKNRIERKQLKEELNKSENLSARAEEINKRYFGNKLKISSIEYVTGQESRFGCCNFRAGSIRISHRVSSMPRWVRDYVIIHELAHLVAPDHSKAFWDIVKRYKFAERAKGYLIAVGSLGKLAED